MVSLFCEKGNGGGMSKNSTHTLSFYQILDQGCYKTEKSQVILAKFWKIMAFWILSAIFLVAPISVF